MVEGRRDSAQHSLTLCKQLLQCIKSACRIYDVYWFKKRSLINTTNEHEVHLDVNIEHLKYAQVPHIIVHKL